MSRSTASILPLVKSKTDLDGGAPVSPGDDYSPCPPVDIIIGGECPEPYTDYTTVSLVPDPNATMETDTASPDSSPDRSLSSPLELKPMLTNSE